MGFQAKLIIIKTAIIAPAAISSPFTQAASKGAGLGVGRALAVGVGVGVGEGDGEGVRDGAGVGVAIGVLVEVAEGVGDSAAVIALTVTDAAVEFTAAPVMSVT